MVLWTLLVDNFYYSLFGKKREEVMQQVEREGQILAEAASEKYALGAAAKALEDIVEVDIPRE